MLELAIFVKRLREQDQQTAGAKKAFILIPVFFRIDPGQLYAPDQIEALYARSGEDGGLKDILEKANTSWQKEWPLDAAYAITRCGLREAKVILVPELLIRKIILGELQCMHLRGLQVSCI